MQQDSLTTENGRVIHAASGGALGYGNCRGGRAGAPAPDDVPLKDPKAFRYIGRPVARLDMRDKSTGRATYRSTSGTTACCTPPSSTAHLRHRTGGDSQRGRGPGDYRASQLVHRLPGAVAVVADSWWRARKGAEALAVTWTKPAAEGVDTVSAGFSSAAMLAALKGSTAPGIPAEQEGDPDAAFAGAAKVVEAEYDAPYLAHAQLEPPASIARFNPDGTLDLWLPNQMPELFQQVAAKVAGLQPEQVRIHSPMLGGFFGRHFYYGPANPFPQAILLAKAMGRPVRVLWSREEEFGMDAVRPLSFARFRAALGADGLPVALQTTASARARSGAGSDRSSRRRSIPRWSRASTRSPTPSRTGSSTT